MSTIRKILIPFDFTEPAVAALDYAMTFVGYDKDIKIEAIYACKVEFCEKEAAEAKNRFAETVATINRRTMYLPDLTVIKGKLVDAILNAKETYEADLILMGTRGASDVDERDSNTSKVVLEADCPVISIPFGSEIEIPKEIALVLGKEEIESPQVLSLLLDVARTFNAKVHVLTIYKESIYEENAIVETNENTLEYYLEHFYAEHSFEKNQDVEQGILDYIEEKNIDLLTIIPRNHAQKTKPSEGRLTKLLTLHSRVPVLTLD